MADKPIELEDLVDRPDLEAAEDHLAPLGARLADAIKAYERKDVDAAGEILRGILRVEPRLAEPRLQLAALLLETSQLEEAEAEAREALALLESGAQWTDDLTEDELLSLAADTLGEVLRQRADTDDVVFGDPEVWRALIDESTALFSRAYKLDPDNDHAAAMVLGYDPKARDEDADDVDEANDPEQDEDLDGEELPGDEGPED